MAQIIQFPGTTAVATPVAAPAPKPKETAAFPVVRHIRGWRRIPKKNRPEDEQTIIIARLARSYSDKAWALAQTEPNSDSHRMALHMAGIAEELPRNNLRCISSTLDEERDFDLRCAEVALLRAEHDLGNCRVDRLAVIENVPWWESATLKPLVEENNQRWDVYRARILELANTPARSHAHLNRKRCLIGHVWLKAEGEWYDQVRAGLAADESWLAEHRPKRSRRAAVVS